MIPAMRASAFLSSALFTVCVQATQVEIAYTGDYFHNTQGGIRTGDTYLDLLELNLSQTFELTNDWALHADIGALYTNGNGLSENIVGDIQVASNLEGGGQFAKLATATLELVSTNGSVKLGLYDINSEFDVLESAELFINSAHGIGSEIALTGENGPSIYPFYSLDNFSTPGIAATSVQITTRPDSDFSFSGLNIISGTNGTITFRLYAWNATNTNGWFVIVGKSAWSDHGIANPGVRIWGNITPTAPNSIESNIITSSFDEPDNIDYTL